MNTRYILCIGAHPDDNELSVGGTAALCRARGDEVRFVSVTSGDKGHYAEEYRSVPERLALRRAAEAQHAAGVIGASYVSLGIPDGEVYVDRGSTEAMLHCIRSFGPAGRGPDLVLLNRPGDYHRDHRYTAQLVLDATYMLTVPLMCPQIRHLERMPVFAYWYDDFQEPAPFRADVVVPIDRVLDRKVEMVAAHVSQVFEWLPYNAGQADQVPGRTDYAARRALVEHSIRSRGAHRRARTADACARWPETLSAQYVEAFQVCPYGRIPSDAEMHALFPITATAG